MSSRREVLIRILALLQRKTLIETKNRTLKWHYWTVRSIKNVALLTEDGAFALFFRPHPGGFASSRVPSPGNLPSKAKKILIPGGQPGGGGPGRRWNWLMHKNNREIIRENAFEQKKKKPGLALLGLRTTGPWGLDGIRPWIVRFPIRSRDKKGTPDLTWESLSANLLWILKHMTAHTRDTWVSHLKRTSVKII